MPAGSGAMYAAPEYESSTSASGDTAISTILRFCGTLETMVGVGGPSSDIAYTPSSKTPKTRPLPCPIARHGPSPTALADPRDPGRHCPTLVDINSLLVVSNQNTLSRAVSRAKSWTPSNV